MSVILDDMERLRSLILDCPDVDTLHRLTRLADGRFLFLVETPFLTWPRFVVGDADALNDAPVLRLRCGRLESAEEHYDEVLRVEGAEQP